ncbi:MAG: DUF5615 family PIN-like protein [Bacteroidia bacterium]|nr:DUF5615 family PIN-like protein [Bacteroidia bacterium]
MKFIADEGVDASIVFILREHEYDVTYVAEFEAGATDSEVMNFSNQEKRILITRDKDFGELVFRLKKVHSGIILDRMARFDAKTKAKIILEVVIQYSQELLGSYTVIQPGNVRIRKIE